MAAAESVVIRDFSSKQGLFAKVATAKVFGDLPAMIPSLPVELNFKAAAQSDIPSGAIVCVQRRTTLSAKKKISSA